MPDADAALAGARDIVAERVTEDAAVRGEARRLALDGRHRRLHSWPARRPRWIPAASTASITTCACPWARSSPTSGWPSTAARPKGALKVRIELPDDDILDLMEVMFPARPAHADRATRCSEAIADGYKRLLAPSLERDLRASRTEEADEHAIQVFSANLRSLLLQPPLRGRVVMGIDPGYRTGCKVAVVDPTGKVLGTHDHLSPPAPEALGRGQGDCWPRPSRRPAWRSSPSATARPAARRSSWWPR